MSLLAAGGHVALFGPPQEDAYSLPLVCRRDDGVTVHGLVLHRGALRQAEHVPGFRRYANTDTTPGAGAAAAAGITAPVPAVAPGPAPGPGGARPRYAGAAG